MSSVIEKRSLKDSKVEEEIYHSTLKAGKGFFKSIKKGAEGVGIFMLYKVVRNSKQLIDKVVIDD